MDVSVIIVNYNTKEITQNCINSVVEKTHDIDYEIILVDNASSDGSREAFLNDQRVKYIQSDVNLGFGKANNLGYKHSKGKYVFLLNSDTILLNNAIKLFYDKMESEHSGIACMGCILQDMEGKKVHSYADFPTTSNFLVERIWGGFSKIGMRPMDKDYPPRNDADPGFYKVDYVTGADLFIRRKAILECGLFDSDFFMYYEDPEMEWRFKKHGYSCYIYSEPQIVHLEGKSFSMTKRKALIVLRSNMLYLHKTQPSYKVLIARILLLIKFAYFNKRYNFNKEELKEYWQIVVI